LIHFYKRNFKYFSFREHHKSPTYRNTAAAAILK